MRELEQELRELAVEFPETPDLAPRLRLPQRPRPVWPRRLAYVAAAAAIAIGAAFAVAPARTAILNFLDLGSVHIEFVDRLPAVTPDAPLALGMQIHDDAAPFRLLHSRLLGDPGAVYQDGVVVSLLYGTETHVRLLVTEIYRSGFTPEYGKKLIATGTRVFFTPIRGATGPGLWIEGAPHVVFLPGGRPRLAGATLIWIRGEITMRLEGVRTQAQAVRIAESFRSG